MIRPSLFSLFSFLYRVISRHRAVLYVLTGAVILCAAFILRDIKMNEDIAPLLPDGQNEAAQDFALLQKAPFAGKVLINLEGGPATSRKDLVEATDKLTRAIGGPYFTRAVSGPTLPSDEQLPGWLMGSLPGTFTDGDARMVQEDLTPNGVHARLQGLYTQLAAPEGLFLKPLLQTDPLELRNLALGKLRHLNIMPGMQLHEKHFMSSDGKNTLVIAETPVEITDSKGSKELVAHLHALIRKVVPSGIEASVISGHVYTTANAETIKVDLVTILTCSSITILLLILAFLRSWKGILVFLVPSSVLCLATAGTLLIYDSVSAVTLAFGSVLLGIADDYPILVYFALCSKERSPGQVVGEVARPVLFGGLTTILTFSVMLFSNLPGQRQLAVFSMIGVAAALVFSLVVLPHLLQSLPGEKRYIGAKSPEIPRLSRRLALCCWLAIIALCLWQAGRLNFNGSLQALNRVPKALQKAEQHVSKTWGNFRDNAILFAEGKDLQSSLEVNDRLFNYLNAKLPEERIISLAPLLPSEATQRMNIRRWDGFWSGGKEALARKLLAQEGGQLGFSPAAFTPFFEMLGKKPSLVSSQDLRSIGFGDLLDSLTVKNANNVQTLTLVPDTKEVVDLFSTDKGKPEGVRLVSQRNFSGIISKALVGNFVSYIAFALLVIIVSVSLLFRNVKKILLALLPVGTGLVFMLGTMGIAGIEFNLFNIVATILVIGLGVDLGIFMVCNITEGYDHTANLAILLGGLTSFVGLGALALARHPALSSIGITVMLGLCGVIPSALFIIPALYGKRQERAVAP